jgi:hypothetical protein
MRIGGFTRFALFFLVKEINATPKTEIGFIQDVIEVSDRSLQSDSCSKAYAALGNDFQLGTSGSCSCLAVGGSGGSRVEATCTSNPVCGLGSCGSATVSGIFYLESDGSLTGNSTDCFTYTSGASGVLCVTETTSGDYCSITVNDVPCTSCEERTCANTSTTQGTRPYANCTNLGGGQIFDLCSNFTVANRSSAFVALDSKFYKKNTSGAANLYRNACGAWYTGLSIGVICFLWSLYT